MHRDQYDIIHCTFDYLEGAVALFPNPAGLWCLKFREVGARASATVASQPGFELAVGAKYTISPSSRCSFEFLTVQGMQELHFQGMPLVR